MKIKTLARALYELKDFTHSPSYEVSGFDIDENTLFIDTTVGSFEVEYTGDGFDIEEIDTDEFDVIDLNSTSALKLLSGLTLIETAFSESKIAIEIDSYLQITKTSGVFIYNGMEKELHLMQLDEPVISIEFPNEPEIVKNMANIIKAQNKHVEEIKNKRKTDQSINKAQVTMPNEDPYITSVVVDVKDYGIIKLENDYVSSEDTVPAGIYGIRYVTHKNGDHTFEFYQEGNTDEDDLVLSPFEMEIMESLYHNNIVLN